MSIPFEDIEPGDSVTIQKEISAGMIDTYAAFTGDFNPVHMDEDYCIRHGLKARIAHGMLVISFVSTLIGMHLPGEGAVWLSQSMDFISPVYAGDTLKITGVVTDKVQGAALSLNMINMKIVIKNQSDRMIARGTARVSVK